MKFYVSTYWNDGNDGDVSNFEANDLDELCTKISGCMEKACGISGVEDFMVEVDGDGAPSFNWTDDDLPRSQSLRDVWNEVKESIREEFKGVFGK